VRRDKRGQGAMKRHRKSVAGVNLDPRTFFPGKSGYGGLDSLAKGMFESQESNYKEGFEADEEKLLQTSWEVRSLIESLQKTSETDNETQA
jgi:hypothetical protein